MKTTKINWMGVGLGTKADRIIAAELGMVAVTVGFWRRRLGILPYKITALRRKQINWDQEPLGKISDYSLGMRHGVSSNIVASEREKRGIPRFRDSFETNWAKVPLGMVSDKDLASSLGVPLKNVQGARQRQGIPNPTPEKKIQWETLPLGEISDAAVARMVGVSTASANHARRSRGIPRRDLICLTTEGERVNYPEAVIDLYWHKLGVPHTAQITVGKYRVDWLLYPNTIVEFAGFSEHRRLGDSYKEKLQHKLEELRDLGYQTQIIWPSELSKYDTHETPRFAESHHCKVCGKYSRTTIRLLCDKHYKPWLVRHHATLPRDEKLKVIRKPLLKAYQDLQFVGTAGFVNFSRKKPTVTGPAGQVTATMKKRTLGVLAEYGLIKFKQTSPVIFGFELLG